MTIELSQEQQRIIERAIQLSVYQNRDEVIGAALSLLDEDIEDAAISEARQEEPRSSLQEVEAELRALGTR